MNKNNRVNLILIELIICLLFFSIASAICVQLFVHAKTIDKESTLHAHAAMAASNIAEAYKGKQLAILYPTDEKGMVYFDRNFNTTTKEKHIYYANLDEVDEALTITIYEEQTSLFSIRCSTYEQRDITKEESS